MKEQGYTLREIAQELGYRSSSSVWELLNVEAIERENCTAYSRVRSETFRKLFGNG